MSCLRVSSVKPLKGPIHYLLHFMFLLWQHAPIEWTAVKWTISFSTIMLEVFNIFFFRPELVRKKNIRFILHRNSLEKKRDSSQSPLHYSSLKSHFEIFIWLFIMALQYTSFSVIFGGLINLHKGEILPKSLSPGGHFDRSCQGDTKPYHNPWVSVSDLLCPSRQINRDMFSIRNQNKTWSLALRDTQYIHLLNKRRYLSEKKSYLWP